MDMQDLENIFWGDRREQPTRVRLARVVRALRDEILRDYGGNNHSWCERVALGAINEILGDAGEKVAGVIGLDPVGAGLSPASGQAPATDPIRNAVAMARGRTLAVDDVPTLNKLAAMMSPTSTPTPERASIGIDPMKACQWDPVKGSDRLWFAWCKTQPGTREYQIAPHTCPVCSLPVKVVGGFSA